MSQDRVIALVGLMGAGKTTVAGLLASRLGGQAIDLDQTLEAEAGCSVADLFRREGEASFRRREAALLARILVSPPSVIACGGGSVIDPESRSSLKASCRVVWLEVSPAEATQRMGNQPEVRPLLAGGPESLETLLRSREACYRNAADVRIATDGRTPDQVAEAVLEALAGARS